MFQPYITNANSFDIFTAACESIKHGYMNSPVDSSEIAAELQRVYDTLLDDLPSASIRQDVLETTGGRWQGAVFPVQVVGKNDTYATVVVGGVAYRGFLLDISLEQFKKLERAAIINNY